MLTRASLAPCFTASYASRLNSNENGWTNDIWRCAIITPAMLRFGEIHHCVPATPPQ